MLHSLGRIRITRSKSLQMETAADMREFPSLNKRRDFFLMFCNTVSLLTGLAGALCALTFGMAIVEGSDEVERQLSQELPWQDRLMALSKHFLRLTGFLGGIVVILIETEWQRLMQYCQLFEFWVARGFFQVYLSSLAYTMIHTDKLDDFSRSVMLYRIVTAAVLSGLGTFYIFSGALCFGALKRTRLRREEERAKVMRDLEDVERRRQELRGLLSENE